MYLVENIMSKPALTIDAQARVLGALEMMKEHNISSLIVNPREPDNTHGIVTKRDIITKVVARDLDPRHMYVSEIMTKPVLKISPHASLRECSILMGKANVRRLPVFSGDALVGIISDTDIFQVVEERGWGPEIETTEQDPFLAGLQTRVRALIAQGSDPDRITNAIMLAVREVYRTLKR